MAHQNLQIKEKICDLPNTTLSIWKVHPDVLREQDKNARVMDTQTFQRLTENIKNNKQLESLPYCHRTMSPGGSEEFSIISGHHRARAARKAGLTFLYILVEEKKLSQAQVTAKQLAHNALAGTDDEQMLAELYASIDDLNARLESGISGLEKDIKDINVKADDISFQFEYEQVLILFLKHEYENFTALIKELEQSMASSKDICLCNFDQFESFKNTIKEVSKAHNIRNTSAVMAKIVEIVRESLRQPKKKHEPL